MKALTFALAIATTMMAACSEYEPPEVRKAESATSPDRRSDVTEQPEPPKLHQELMLAKLTRTGDKVALGKWESSHNVIPQAGVRVAVVATWCPYSVKFVDKTAKLGELSKYDLILVYENEAEMKLKSAVRDNEVTQSEADAIAKVLTKRGQFLLAPEVIDPKLPFYAIRKDQLAQVVDGFPSAVACNPSGCRKVDRDY